MTTEMLPNEIVYLILSFCDDATLCSISNSIPTFLYEIQKIKLSPLRLNCPNLGRLCKKCGHLYCNECQGLSLYYCDDCGSHCLCGNKIESPINSYVMHCVICGLALCNDSKCVSVPWDLSKGRHNEEYTHLDCCNKKCIRCEGDYDIDTAIKCNRCMLIYCYDCSGGSCKECESWRYMEPLDVFTEE